MKVFGKLSQVNLREYWENEAGDFTPWLAKENNLALLGEAVGMELELEGTERSVGDFKVDILAKDTDSDKYIVIENQLEKTNHNHLGQLITYASGYSAKAVIWIAKEICEEHRKALDWLNEKSTGDVAFFGVEMELWKIGDSQPAPRFNLISQPNDWARIIQSAGNANHRKLTETKILQKEFWTAYVEYMKENNTFLNLRTPRPQHWYTFAVGRSGFWISLTINSRLHQIGCKLGIRKTQYGFEQLKEDKEMIEKELNSHLEWKELPHRKESKIAQFSRGDFQNKGEWPQLFEWFKERAEAFYTVFSERVKNLDLDDEAA